MEDNVLGKNTPPLQGDAEGTNAGQTASANPIGSTKPSIMNSFFRRFGGGASQPAPEQAPADITKFSTLLGEISNQPAGANPADAVQSMAGAVVVNEPSPMPPSIDSAAVQVQSPSQELPQAPVSGDSRDNPTAPVTSIGEIPVESLTPVTAKATAPDSNTSAVVDSLVPEMSAQPMGGIKSEANPVSSPEADPNKTLLINTRASLVSMGDQARQWQEAIDKNLKEIDEVMGTNLAGASTNTPVETPK